MQLQPVNPLIFRLNRDLIEQAFKYVLPGENNSRLQQILIKAWIDNLPQHPVVHQTGL